MKKIIALLLISLILLFPKVCFAKTAKKSVNIGNRLYHSGDFDQALKNYNEAVVDSPDSDIINFNLGAAFYQKEDYDKALEHFTKALMSDDKTVEADALYNMGNCKYKSGRLKKNTDLAAAISLYRASLDYYKRAIELDQSNQDARFNHEFIERELKILLDQLKQQQQEQKQSGQDKQQEQQQKQCPLPGSNQDDKKQGKEEQKKSGSKQEQEQADKEEGKQVQPAQSEREDNKELSEEQARMLLERYKQNEGGQLTMNQDGQRGYYPRVLKDW